MNDLAANCEVVRSARKFGDSDYSVWVFHEEAGELPCHSSMRFYKTDYAVFREISPKLGRRPSAFYDRGKFIFCHPIVLFSKLTRVLFRANWRELA
jgi:hypothetical protein